uniref:Uncharacterized protein n=1 Tax=Zea mays TaxID=4577 RepID=C4J0U4_MAIZE|nr:unknown [Zea mays]
MKRADCCTARYKRRQSPSVKCKGDNLPSKAQILHRAMRPASRLSDILRSIAASTEFIWSKTLVTFSTKLKLQ